MMGWGGAATVCRVAVRNWVAEQKRPLEQRVDERLAGETRGWACPSAISNKN